MSDAMALFHFDSSRPSFESLGTPNGVTHWTEEVLMRALGYDAAQSFGKAIMRAKQACLSLNIHCEEHFALQSDGTHIVTRFGCYLVAMNADNKKPEVAAAQVYFAKMAQAWSDHLEHCESIERVLVRNDITQENKSLASTGKQHGLKNFAFFQSKGYMGMYNMSLEHLKRVKGVAENENMLDRMGKTELAANLFRITQTEEKIKNDKIYGQDNLERAAYDVGKKVRRTVQEISGTVPEHLPPAENINEVRKKLKATRNALKSVVKKPPPRISK